MCSAGIFVFNEIESEGTLLKYSTIQIILQ